MDNYATRMLTHHVTGAIERGEKEAITAMTHRNPNQLVEDGFVYMARQYIPYSNDERRLYSHTTEGHVVLRLRGITVVESHHYEKSRYEYAQHHLKNGK